MKKTLYTGLTPPFSTNEEEFIHFPTIKIVPRESSDLAIVNAVKNMPFYTHIIFTSKSTVQIFKSLFNPQCTEGKIILSVGKATSRALQSEGIHVDFTATCEQAEGVIALLEEMQLDQAKILWPHSNRARDLISSYLESRQVTCDDIVVYETLLYTHDLKVPPDVFESIIFTSPSTVDGFFANYAVIPANTEVRCIGAITQAHYDKMYRKDNNR
ncbi:MAG: uroporphyrinogen-III synthase [Chlamydiota bacterium]|nr:uroporphyrinogen-III synthase [Chlamydiota bacterium]